MKFLISMLLFLSCSISHADYELIYGSNDHVIQYFLKLKDFTQLYNCDVNSVLRTHNGRKVIHVALKDHITETLMNLSLVVAPDRGGPDVLQSRLFEHFTIHGVDHTRVLQIRMDANHDPVELEYFELDTEKNLPFNRIMCSAEHGKVS